MSLRPLTMADAPALHRAYGDPVAMRFWDFPASTDLAETTRRIEWSLRIDPQWHAAWAVVNNEDRSLIGMVNYHHREAWNRRLEIGYILLPAYWRRGLMREALTALLNYCFDELDVHRVEATIEPENAASRKLAERLGFVCESGKLRDRMMVEGKFRDMLMYGLLADDWRAAR